MPVFISPLQNTYRSVDRPCVEQVIGQLIKEGILYNPEVLTHTDTVFSVRKRTSKIIYNQGRLTLELAPIFEQIPDQSDWSLKHRWVQMPLLFDDTNGVRMYPMLVDYQATIKLTYTDDNLELLRHVRENLLNKRLLGWYGSPHTLQYNMIPSVDTDTLLREIHGRREAKFGYGESFADYMEKYSNPEFHDIVAGEWSEGSFGLNQIMIEGNLEGEIEPIEEYMTGIYSLSFTYKYRYSRPTGMVAEYPIQVHQQLLPKYFTTIVNSNLHAYGITDLPIVKAFTYSTGGCVSIRIPGVDMEPMRNFVIGYRPIWTALLSLDDVPVDQQILCKLDDVPDLMMDGVVYEYLRKVYADAITPYKTPFLLTLKRDDEVMDERYLTVDSDLNVKLTVDVNKRYVYRLSFCILTDMAALAANALPIIRSVPGLDVAIVDTVNALGTCGAVTSQIIPKDLTNIAYLRTVNPLVNTGNGLTRQPGNIIGFRTVQDAWVTSYRK